MPATCKVSSRDVNNKHVHFMDISTDNATLPRKSTRLAGGGGGGGGGTSFTIFIYFVHHKFFTSLLKTLMLTF